MTAPTPPLFWQLLTLAAKLIVPRAIRHTLPYTVLVVWSPRPKSASGAVADLTGEPSMLPGLYTRVPTVRNGALAPLPGTLESTDTPGAEISTLLLYCENEAQFLFSSSAPTIITLL